MALLTQAQVICAKAWLHDIFVWGGLVTDPKRDIKPDDYYYTYGAAWKHLRGRNIEAGTEAAKKVCEIIQTRKADTRVFMSLDKALDTLSGFQFVKDIHISDPHASRVVVQKDAATLAEYLAWFCSTNQLYWDTSNCFPYEIDEIKNTVSGAAMWEASCFNCQALPKQRQRATSNTAVAGTSTASGGSTAGALSPYKARGPLSDQAIGLIGTPHTKIYANPSSSLFSINGIDPNTQQVSAKGLYIRPVEGTKYSDGNNKCKVYYGSTTANGYCPVLFADVQTADAFMVDAIKNNITSANLVVAQKKATNYKGGLFQINTELGPVYISASLLNEDIEEEMEENQNTTNKEQEIVEESKKPDGKASKLSNREKWEIYESAYFKD